MRFGDVEIRPLGCAGCLAMILVSVLLSLFLTLVLSGCPDRGARGASQVTITRGRRSASHDRTENRAVRCDRGARDPWRLQMWRTGPLAPANVTHGAQM